MENVHLTITAPLVQHVQRGAHLSLAAACEELAEQARSEAPSTHRTSIDRLDTVRALLDTIGWDGSTTPPADPKLIEAKFGGYHDTVLWLSTYFDTLYDALTRVLAALLPEQGRDGSSPAFNGLVNLLETLDGWVESVCQTAEERAAMEAARRGPVAAA
jgi:hypothetical protein